MGCHTTADHGRDQIRVDTGGAVLPSKDGVSLSSTVSRASSSNLIKLYSWQPLRRPSTMITTAASLHPRSSAEQMQAERCEA